jgi:hypothetical protein
MAPLSGWPIADLPSTMALAASKYKGKRSIKNSSNCVILVILPKVWISDLCRLATR